MSYSFSYDTHAQSVQAGVLAPLIIGPSFKAASGNRKPVPPETERVVEPTQPTANTSQEQDPGTYNANGQTPTPLGSTLDVVAA